VLKFAIPILHVGNSIAAEDFYCGQLGFRREFAYRPGDAGDPCYMGVTRDHIRLHLSSFSGDGVAGGAVYLAVDDVDTLHAEFRAKGIVIDTAPVDQTWGNREMYVKDPDGNSLRFTQERGGR
jgi:uncharacterized glyoxalase superfamily protein PhnB